MFYTKQILKNKEKNAKMKKKKKKFQKITKSTAIL